MHQTRIIIGSDHAGFQCKSAVIQFLQKIDYNVSDQGTHHEQSCDYPDIAHRVAKAVDNQEFAVGILICGSGIGVSIVANKYKNVRAALCWQKDIAELSRLHNNANIICLPARFLDNKTAVACVQKFLETAFEGGRHELRVQKIGRV